MGLRFLATVAIAFVSSATGAASYTYVLEGDLASRPGSVDLYNVDGAHFQRRIDFNPEIPPFKIQPEWDDASHDKDAWFSFESDSLRITNRPNGLIAVSGELVGHPTTPVELGQGAATRVFVEYAVRTETKPDLIRFMEARFTVLAGLNIPEIRLWLTPDFFGDDVIPQAPPASPIVQWSDVVNFEIVYFDSLDDYTISNLSISTVPIPAAAWLFGSVVAIGIASMRRRAN